MGLGKEKVLFLYGPVPTCPEQESIRASTTKTGAKGHKKKGVLQKQPFYCTLSI